MIKVSIFYPSKPGSRFDGAYYLSVHMPLAVKLLGPALKAVTVELGVSGGAPDQDPPFAAICGFTCDSVQDFMDAFVPHQTELQNDIPNYTDIVPLIQVSQLTDLHVGSTESS
jgi:uncharacterized protein (TIGR02118 family)